MWRKFAATVVNVAIAAVIASPVLLVSVEAWRPAILVVFFGYNACVRRRCVGAWLLGLHYNRPASLRYVALYTMGLSSCLYSLVYPGDLFLLNGVLQGLCLWRTGMTVHGWLSGVYTYTGRRVATWS